MLIKDELLYSLNDCKYRIENLLNLIDENNYEAFFIYSFSIFESAILYINRYILITFPKKIDKKFDINAIKSDMINNPYDKNNIELLVESYLNKVEKGSLFNLLSILQKNCRIEIDLINEKENINHINKLRNELIHDYYGYKNPSYKSSDVIKEYIKIMVKYTDKLIEKIGDKYRNCTRKKFVEGFWNKVFDTPLLPFDKCITFKEDTMSCESICINIDHIQSVIGSLSSSEKFFLSIILQQYSSNINEIFFRFSDIPMLVSISQENQKKIYYLLETFRKHPYLFNGMDMK